MYDYYDCYEPAVYDRYPAEGDANSYNRTDDLFNKIQQTHQMMDYLKQCLAIERENLKMERLQSQTAFHVSSSMSLPSHMMSYPAYYDLSAYYGQEWPMAPYPSLFQYENTCNGYVKRYRRSGDPQLYAHFYKGQLEDVERKCNEELHRMQTSISDLRKIRRHWASYEPENTLYIERPHRNRCNYTQRNPLPLDDETQQIANDMMYLTI